MTSSNEMKSDVQAIIDKPWNKRSGQKIPSTDEVLLAGGAVELEATFLYADLAKSSNMAKVLDRRVVAKIIKSFLATSSKLIKRNGGEIISFDGDRVLGVFYGDSKNTNAAKCGLQIKWTVNKVIKPKFEANYKTVREASFTIAHAVGIDTGTILAVRGGVRGGNDLIWIGRAPNLAAKLSELRESSYQTFITKAVYDKLNKSSKYGGEDKKNMWEERSWTFLESKMTLYRSSWHWSV